MFPYIFFSFTTLLTFFFFYFIWVGVISIPQIEQYDLAALYASDNNQNENTGQSQSQSQSQNETGGEFREYDSTGKLKRNRWRGIGEEE